MEVKVDNIQNIAAEAWMKRDPGTKENRAIQPVSKAEGGRSPEVQKDRSPMGSGAVRGVEPSPEEVEGLVEEVDSFLESLSIKLSFEMSEDTEEPVVKVVDSETGDVIRQIPPEVLMKLREKMQELQGILFDQKV